VPGRHRVHLNLGSNVRPEQNLPAAVTELGARCEVVAVSGVVETEAVGFEGGNFCNVCVEIRTDLDAARFKTEVARVVEQVLGRVRTGGKLSDHGIDVDIVIFDGEVVDRRTWPEAFVLVPTAELLPDFADPDTGVALRERAAAVRSSVWLRDRPDIVLATG
jgi:2-amino-4-hydroxy-6-hydroxymethyldihydropteridine diphosphokinase